MFAIAAGEQRYKDVFSSYMSTIRDTKPYTPGGMVFLDMWGSCRHAANVAFLAHVVCTVATSSSVPRTRGRLWAGMTFNLRR